MIKALMLAMALHAHASGLRQSSRIMDTYLLGHKMHFSGAPYS
jgi:hypothetical protein